MRFRFIACFFLLALTLNARVTRIVIDYVESPAYNGRKFGAVGAYERLTGHAYGELDPVDPRNAIITDLQLAPRNSRSFVEYTATFTLWKPIDLSKMNPVLIYDVPNRGSHLLLSAFQGGDPGDGFFFERGYAILSSGWQGDVIPKPGVESLSVPIAVNPDGSSITGPVLARFSDLPAGTKSISLASVIPRQPYPPASVDTTQATLTKRASAEGVAIPLSSNDWAFGDCRTADFPGVVSHTMICLKNGFDPAYLYELVYTAKNPLVLGIGLAATRDIVSFFRHETPANPIAGRVKYVIGQGISQSGNFVKTMIHLGFNEDENKRIVWDGANDHIAGRQVPLNIRFAVPGGAAELYQPGSEPALWWSDYQDTARGRRTAGMLDRCRTSHTCPKIFETFGSTEFWELRMSPGLVGTKADIDIPLPPNVRRYFFPGTTHGGGRGGFSTVVPSPMGHCELPDNPNPEKETMRALLDALVAWVAHDTAPPLSRYPRLDQVQLVAPDARSMGFPFIPNRPLPDHLLNPVYDYDLGPSVRYNDMSGVITRQPPTIKQIIPSLVPKVDADGNEVGGIGSVLFQAPLGTYLGWNVTASGFFKDRACGFSGGFIPFAATKAERLASADPRLSLEERYPTQEAYLAKVKKSADALVRDRFLLPSDAAVLLKAAAIDSSSLFKDLAK